MGRHIEKDTMEEKLDPRTTLEIESFLAWLDVQRGLSPTTQIAYGTDLRQLALFLAQRGASLARPAEVSKKHIQAWLARLYALGEAKSSMARKLAAARTFFRYQQRMGRTENNVAAQVRNPKQEQRHPRVLNVDQAFAVLDTPDALEAWLRAAGEYAHPMAVCITDSEITLAGRDGRACLLVNTNEESVTASFTICGMKAPVLYDPFADEVVPCTFTPDGDELGFTVTLPALRAYIVKEK